MRWVGGWPRNVSLVYFTHKRNWGQMLMERNLYFPEGMRSHFPIPFCGGCAKYLRILPLFKIQTQTVTFQTHLQAFWNSISPLSLDVSVFGNPPTEQPTFITVKKKLFCRKMAITLSLYWLGWYLRKKKKKKTNYTISSSRAIICRRRRFVIYGSFFSTRGFNVRGAAWWESRYIHRQQQHKASEKALFYRCKMCHLFVGECLMV